MLNIFNWVEGETPFPYPPPPLFLSLIMGRGGEGGKIDGNGVGTLLCIINIIEG